MWSRTEQFFCLYMLMTNLLGSIYLYAADEGDHLVPEAHSYAYSGKKLILVYFYLYICHWILDISIIYSEISASKYHGIHVDYIDELQHDFISPACSSMKPVNCVYSLILNPLSLIFLSDYPVSGCLVKMPMNFSQICNTSLSSAQAGVPGYV